MQKKIFLYVVIPNTEAFEKLFFVRLNLFRANKFNRGLKTFLLNCSFVIKGGTHEKL